jgi:hypothetical protein
MADDSELDYIRTFVGEVMTGYTIKQFSEVKLLSLINDAQRGLVYPGEPINVSDVYYTKRYKLALSDTTEAALQTAYKLLMAGVRKYNSRLAGPTQVADMTHISISSGTPDYEQGQTKRWYTTFMLDIVWSID